jgi:EmrB/QacA subfamily drug resistance transporter
MAHEVAGRAQPSAAPTAATPDPRRWRALALLAVAQFMVILDISVVNVALPDIGVALGLGREGLTWVITAYTLCFGGLMIFGGRAADLLGSRRTFLAGLAVFTAASALAGLTRDGSWLVAARAFQGVGAALLSPSALATVTAMFTGRERYRALGVWGGLGGAGAAAGVLLGGILVSGPGWPWIFYVNVPIGLAVMLLTPRTVPPAAPRPGRVDVAGALLVTGGLGTVIYGLIEAGTGGWSGAATLVPLAAGAALLAAFVAVERSAGEPLVPPAVVAHRAVVSGLLVMILATGLLITSFFLGSVMLQRVVGLSALEVGWAFLPVAVATGVGAHLGSRLLPRVGPRAVAAGGFATAAAGLFLMSRIDADARVLTGVLPGFLVSGLALGTAFVVATTTALGTAPAEHAGALSATVNTSHEVGASLGVAVFSTIAGTSLSVQAPPTTAGFELAFAVAAATALAAAVTLAAALPAGRPAIGDQPTFMH